MNLNPKSPNVSDATKIKSKPTQSMDISKDLKGERIGWVYGKFQEDDQSGYADYGYDKPMGIVDQVLLGNESSIPTVTIMGRKQNYNEYTRKIEDSGNFKLKFKCGEPGFYSGGSRVYNKNLHFMLTNQFCKK